MFKLLFQVKLDGQKNTLVMLMKILISKKKRNISNGPDLLTVMGVQENPVHLTRLTRGERPAEGVWCGERNAEFCGVRILTKHLGSCGTLGRST